MTLMTTPLRDGIPLKWCKIEVDIRWNGKFSCLCFREGTAGRTVFLCADTIFNKVSATLKIVKISLKIVKKWVRRRFRVW